jgi:hypothetical protein
LLEVRQKKTVIALGADNGFRGSVLCVRPLSTPVFAGENNFPCEKDNKADYGTDVFHVSLIAHNFPKP